MSSINARSMLFVPADSERKLAKSLDSDADALILDLEDSVALERKELAREQAAEFVDGNDAGEVWIRINPLLSGMVSADIATAVRPGVSGLVWPKANGADELRQLDLMITRAEATNDVAMGSTKILAIATETPAAVFALGSYAGVSPRLAGLTWGAEDLPAAIGAITSRGEDGHWLGPYQMLRSMCLFAAGAAGVTAVEAVVADFKNESVLRKVAMDARRDGFSSMMAIHPAQVGPINEAMTPSVAEIEHAQRIVDLFAANPDAGVLSLEGQMIDRPHLTQALRILARG